jgi:hypothetical protein
MQAGTVTTTGANTPGPAIGDLVRALRTANPHWPIGYLGYLGLKVGLTEQEVRAILRGGLGEARADTSRAG